MSTRENCAAVDDRFDGHHPGPHPGAQLTLGGLGPVGLRLGELAQRQVGFGLDGAAIRQLDDPFIGPHRLTRLRKAQGL